MSRLAFLSIAIILSLLPVVAPAAPAHKRPTPRSGDASRYVAALLANE
jgi:hypothetical protein